MKERVEGGIVPCKGMTGLDHPWVVEDNDNTRHDPEEMRHAATLSAADTTMEVFTT